jgi:fucose 4-O-acetylase-like acetyltransferase
MPEKTDFLKKPNARRVRSNPRSTGRDESLDIAKGFAILLVVLGHCFDGLIASGFFPAALGWPNLVVYLIYLFHMPLFFVVSGHLASGKFRPVSSTLARLLQTIVYPYFLWSILEGLTLVYLSRYTNSHVPISTLYSIPWIPIVPYWFLYALFLCHVAYLALRRLPHWVQLGVAAILFLLLQFFIPAILGAGLSIVPETARGLLYFILGVVSVASVRQFGRWTALSATTIFFLFAILYYQSQITGPLAAPAALPAGIAGVVATLAWSRMLAARGGWLASCLGFWGRYSMSIYVMHIFFTAGTRIAVQRLHLGQSPRGVGPTLAATLNEILAATAAGVLLPLGINRVTSAFDLDKWFGLQHMETN